MANSTRRERLRAAEQAEQRRKRRRALAVGGVVVGALIVIVAMLWSSLGAGRQPDATRPPNATAAGDGIVVNPAKAASGAPVVGVYFDYQCSHCVEFEDKFGLAINQLADSGEIQLIHHTMVFLDKGNDAGLSHKAAIGAACADLGGVYAAYHQGVFAAAYNGPYTDALLRDALPARAGLSGEDLDAFQSCYDAKSMLGWVNGVNELAAKSGITGTPALTVNGKQVDLTTLPSDGSKIRDVLLNAR